MTFPVVPLASKVELYVGGAWVDITSDVYHRDPITITRGRTSHSDDVDPSRCQLTLNNTSGKYSPRNPTGAYYGLIGRNTPLRVSVNAGSVALDLPGAVFDWAITPDDASLDIVGDLDVRLDATLNNWLDPASDPTGFDHVDLIGKCNITGQDSWLLAVRAGNLFLRWSADGTNTIGVSSTVPLPAGPNTRMAVRATLDVNNGAAGNTVTFYTADTLSGEWVQLGDPVTTAGTTSVFASTASLKIGDATNISFGRAAGLVHAAEVRNGIGGTIVANPDFSAQASGTTSFVDGAGRTWTLGGNASITNRKIRFVGEVSEWPVEWDVSGEDVYTQVTASGVLRRLTQGQSPIKSTLARRLPTLGPLAYWPMEEGANSTVAYSPIAGVRDMVTSGLTFAAVDTLDGSSALPTVATASEIEGTVPAPSSTQTSWQVEFVYNLNASPASYVTVLRITSTGTVKTWYLQLSNGTSRILGYDEDGVAVVSDVRVTGTDLNDGRWNRWRHILSESGGTVTYQTTWVNVGGSGGTATGTYAGTIGRVKSVGSPDEGYHADVSGMAIGHVSVFSPSQSTAYNNVDIGLRGETAGERIDRLCDEESITVAISGVQDIQAEVGPQRPAGVLEILNDCADADGGILYESRTAAALAYRDASSLYNQRVRLALDYETAGHVAPPFKPVDDDQYVRNEITVTRKQGASAVSELTSGPLSTQAPPNGVGRYQEQKEINFYTDDQPAQLAEWLLYLGTWDEARYPTVRVDLAAGPSLIDDATAVDVGDRVTIDNPPAWLPPDDIDLLVQGYSEVIGLYDWEVTYNCTPGAPWSSIAQVDTARADTAGSSLASSATSTATTLSVATTSGPIWTDDATDWPFDIRVAGERVTVNAVGETLNANPDFDTDVTGWSAVNGALSWSTAQARHGAGSALMVTAAGDFPRFEATSVPVTPGVSYRAVGWVFVDSAISTSVDLNINWFDVNGNYLSTSANGHVPEAGVWELRDDVYTAPVGAATGSVLVSCGGAPGAGFNVRGDAIRMIPVSTYEASPQTFSVARSVNGVVKAQSEDASVSLWSPYYVPYL